MSEFTHRKKDQEKYPGMFTELYLCEWYNY